MTRVVLIMTFAAAVLCGSCAADAPAASATAASNPAATQPALDKPPAASQPADPKAVAILKHLEVAVDKHPTIRADINHLVESDVTGDQEQRTGTLSYQAGNKKAGTPTRFYILFKTLRQGEGRAFPQKQEYAFDGTWLSDANHSLKRITRYQVVAKGREIEPMKIGEGPIPLPIGQKTEDVLKHYHASTRPLRKRDPNSRTGRLLSGSEYLLLKLKPKFKSDTSIRKLEIWVNLKTRLPVKIISYDHKGDVTTVEFRNVKTGLKFKRGFFSLPTPFGWKETRQPLKPDTRTGP